MSLKIPMNLDHPKEEERLNLLCQKAVEQMVWVVFF